MSNQAKIMMIDDNQSSNLYHSIMIEEAGIDADSVVEFFSVTEAIEYIQTHLEKDNADLLPQIILLDINMPRKNGWQFVEEIEGILNSKYQPHIYMVSNSRHPLDIKKAKENPLIKDLFEKHLKVDFFLNLKSTYGL